MTKIKPTQTINDIKNAIAILAILISSSFIIFVFGSALFIAFVFGKPVYFKEDDVTATCEALNLSPDTIFCTNSKTSNETNLRLALSDEYPIGQTIINELVEEWNVDFRYISDSCEQSSASIRACPVLDGCALSESDCYAYLPVQRIRIFLDAQGLVTRYIIPDTK
jgi:hypothetical protein